jgi:hypothetical protein
VPCGIDLFHIVKDFGDAISYYENRHRGAFNNRLKIEAKMERLRRAGKPRTKLSRTLGLTRAKEGSLTGLVDDLTLLLSWLKDDALAVGGMSLADRNELLDFIIAELRRREDKCYKVRRLRRRLEDAKDGLLSGARRIDELLDGVVLTIGVARPLLDQMAIMLGFAPEDPKRYQLEASLRRSLRGSFYVVQNAVAETLASTPRASSTVENLNSVLRSYFSLRRDVGGGYLDLLRFYLNHRVIERSRCNQREGMTPRQMLTSQEHRHWLEMLGFQRFQRAA